MGQSGPAPKPNELKAREGNAAGANLNPVGSPAVDYVDTTNIPEPPSFVDDITGARERWNKLVPALLLMGVFAKSDVAIVGRYCVSVELYSRAAKAIESDGLTMKYASGATQVSAALTAFSKLNDQCLKLEVQLGLTPSARTRVTTWGGNRPPKTPQDDVEPDSTPPAIDENYDDDGPFLLTQGA